MVHGHVYRILGRRQRSREESPEWICESRCQVSVRLQRGTLGGTQYRNTVRKIGKYRNTLLKIDEIPIPQ